MVPLVGIDTLSRTTTVGIRQLNVFLRQFSILVQSIVLQLESVAVLLLQVNPIATVGCLVAVTEVGVCPQPVRARENTEKL